ncbi:MAG: DUF3187 family protein [Longimicrobiales bacterium]
MGRGAPSPRGPARPRLRNPPANATDTTATAPQTADPLAELTGPLGPLRVAERNPLYHLFLTPTVEGTEVLEGGAWRVGISTAYSNIFEYNSSEAFLQLFDLERASTVVALSRGLGGGVEIGASLGLQHNWGGFLDPAIQGLHDLFGLPNADREKVENGGFDVYLGSRARRPQVFIDLPPGTGMEAPRAWVAWRLAGGPRSRGDITLRTTVKFPGGDHRASSRGTDVAAELAVRRSWGATHLHASGGLVRFEVPTRLAPIMRDEAWFGSVALEQRVASWLSLVGQFFGGSRYASGFGFEELDNLPLNLAVGGRGRLGEAWRWQVSFTEDVPPNSPSVDFTLDVALTRTWAPGG